ncbi:MAG: tRNA uridine-5-carboxymethylaminomethyl(34) synthesis GTPase MnmE [Gammaproteobacteria bacterium]|nr:tRNA uridine-5-carboxymethylaminomethyl(34) synthesis GTPase MnmE [Gammaproteobacteria bacterium]MCP5138222.1 tRNA uridine-5-carboxymethylaminomethyl(34) synthesis GTPase MnmE [Gammaproteobacteria bacterium]
MAVTDTIAAVATPPGRGGVGIVRVSGPLALQAAKTIIGVHPRPRIATYRAFRDAEGTAIDDGIALFFPAPNSFTGEDVIEFQGHGGPVVLDMLMATLGTLGIRPARPGEFSERAFLNDKLDLAQAEAVADLIDSASKSAARAALNSLHGAFSMHVNALVEALIELRIYVEAAIDFPEEEVDFLADQGILSRMDGIDARLTDTLAGAHQGALLRDGMNLVIAGRPNAGKSSLLNALAGTDAAIVTDAPGTTRDVLRERIEIDGLPIHVIDTAGIRATDDAIELEGIRRAWREVGRADRLLLVMDAREPMHEEDHELLARIPPNLPVTLLHNKIDLLEQAAPPDQDDERAQLWVSVKAGIGMDRLRAHLKRAIGFQPLERGGFSARRRHLDALQRAKGHLHDARHQLAHCRAGELVAEDLRLAQNALAEITGRFTSDDLLGRIFSSFCIGK